MKAIRADDYISAILRNNNRALAEHMKADVIMLRSPIGMGLEQAIRYEVEALCDEQRPKRPSKLCMLIETNGGHIEVVERIYNVLRKHYSFVSFVVPNYAYSAGTVLVLSGDEIYMDYHSVLGPIDPQYEQDGRFLPGLGYLRKYEELVKKINSADDPVKVRAELSYLLGKFEPAILFWLEQAKSHSVSLLQEWLPRHKFKRWKITKSSRKKVTPAMRRERAKDVATVLGDASRWHSHGRGIGIRELTSDEIKLEIVNFGEDKTLNSLIGSYYHLFFDYCGKIGASGMNCAVIHSANGLRKYA